MTNKQLKNSSAQLVSSLFDDFNLLSNPDLTGDRLVQQSERIKVKLSIAKHITDIARLALEAKKALPDMLDKTELPPLLDLDK